ncbi:hypothetical protein FRB98_009691 [Tulasnella sp. 332]|nr:hypothetical protein FRB98_009691 [Tulasnella sp. 332]
MFTARDDLGRTPEQLAAVTSSGTTFLRSVISALNYYPLAPKLNLVIQPYFSPNFPFPPLFGIQVEYPPSSGSPPSPTLALYHIRPCLETCTEALASFFVEQLMNEHGLRVKAGKTWLTHPKAQGPILSCEDFVSSLQRMSPRIPLTSTFIGSIMQVIVERSELGYTDIIIRMLGLCHDTGKQAAYFPLQPRPRRKFTTVNSIERILLLCMFNLVEFLGRRNIASAVEPYRKVFRTIMIARASKVLGVKPEEADPKILKYQAMVRKNSCTCTPCRQMIAFLTTRTKARSFKLGAYYGGDKEVCGGAAYEI